MQAPVYILVPVFNRKAITIEFCRQIKAQTYTNYQIIVIDDGSTDGTSEEVTRLFPQTQIIRTPGNFWWGGCLQQGYQWITQHSSPEGIVLIANDDMTIEENYIENAVSILQKSKMTLLGSVCWGKDKQKPIDRGIRWDWNGRRLTVINVGQIDQINCLSTRGLYLRVRDFIELGGFYPKMLPHYLSDYEYTMRAYQRGYKLITDETVFVKTKDDSSGISSYDTSSWGKFLRQYLSPRNYHHPFYTMSFIFLACPSFKLRWKNYINVVIEICRAMRPLMMQNKVLKIVFLLLRAFYRTLRYLKSMIIGQNHPG